jgi:hypothetical protein
VPADRHELPRLRRSAQCDSWRTNGFCAVATARRDAGGKLDATIAKIPVQRISLKKMVPAHLGGTIAIADLPMSLINGLVGKKVTGGLFSTTPPVGRAGRPASRGHDPAVARVGVQRFPRRSAARGRARHDHGMSGLKITGKALADRISITGTIGTAAPYPVEIQLSGRRIELDQFRRSDVDGRLAGSDPAWVTGKLTLKTELAPLERQPAVPDAWIELVELVAIIDHRSTDGRQTPLRLSVIDEEPGDARRGVAASRRRATSSRAATATPSKTMPCSTKVATPAGVIVIAGRASGSDVALTADTTPDHPLELALLASLLDHQFDEVSGHLQLHASIAGALTKPSVVVEIDIDPANGGVRLLPHGQDVVLRATAGQVRYANKSLGFNDVQISIDDPNRKDEQRSARSAAAGSTG